GFDHRKGVPMIGRADQHNVEVLLLEHLVVIAVQTRLFLRNLPGSDQFGGVGEHFLVDVAERNNVDRGNLNQAKQITFAVPTSADEADAFPLVGEFGGIVGQGGESDGGGGSLEKSAAVHGLVLGSRSEQCKWTPRGGP